MLYKIARVLYRFLARIVYKIQIDGIENVPKKGKLILCSNHKTNMDPFFLMAFFPRQPLFMGKVEAFKNPIIGFLLKCLGVFPVSRGTGDEKAIVRALDILKEDKVLAMFPEGTRVRNGLRVTAKKGVGFISTYADAPVIPVFLLSDFKPFTKVKCIIGKPIYICKDDYGILDRDAYYKISNEILDKIYTLDKKQDMIVSQLI